MKTKTIGRIFILLFSVVSLFTAIWIFHTHTVLENNGSPHAVIKLFNINNDLLYNVVTIFSLIFLILSNIFYWRTGNGFFFLLSVFYFTAGIVLLSILEDARFFYTKQNGLLKATSSSGFITTTYLILIVAIGVLINFFIIKYIRSRFIFKEKKL